MPAPDTRTDALIAAYELLSEALPLALGQVGQRPVFEQWCFWAAFRQVELYVEDIVALTEPTPGLECPLERAAEALRPVVGLEGGRHGV